MGDSDAAGMIERLRSFGVGVALSGQSFEGLGPDRTRIVEAAGTLLLHRLSASDELAHMAGTVQDYAVTTQVDFDTGATGRGTMTPEHRFKAEPNAIGRQRDGEITVVSDRCDGHGFVTRPDPSHWREIAPQILVPLATPRVGVPSDSPRVVELGRVRDSCRVVRATLLLSAGPRLGRRGPSKARERDDQHMDATLSRSRTRTAILIGISVIVVLAIALFDLLSGASPEPFAGRWMYENGQPVPRGSNEPLVFWLYQGHEHCGWESATFAVMSWPPGSKVGPPVPVEGPDVRQFVRDPEGVVSDTLARLLQTDADLPPEARSLSMHRGEWEVHLDQSRDDFLYLVSPTSTERWPSVTLASREEGDQEHRYCL